MAWHTYSRCRLAALLLSLLQMTSILCSCTSKNTLTDQADEALVTRCRIALKPYIKRGFNPKVAFYIDLTRPSNQYRFFVLDLHRSLVLAQGLCCNGRTDAKGTVIYSNIVNSNCSSHGVAKVSYAYQGQFGKAFKLEGLEPSNSNMFARAVVLHAHSCIPAEPQQEPICVSEGCPTVNPDFLKELSRYIENSPKPVLLYIQ